MKHHIITLGCQMNQADSDLMGGLLAHAGWEPAESYEDANLMILNTCSVRERPEHKVFSLLGELVPWKAADPRRVLAVAGCMAQRAADEIRRRAPHVDIIMGTRAFHRIEELVGRVQRGERPVLALEMEPHPALPMISSSSVLAPSPRAERGTGGEVPLRAFVPIIRGCTNFCSYCIVPYVRGPESSRPAAEICREVESLVARGTREVTLLGQNVLAYGRDLSERRDFPDLLSRLNGIEGLWRIRFTTSHPRDVSGDLVEAMAGLPKVCEHIHLPIQAGADRLLADMNRGYTTARYLEIIDELRSRVPGIAITTDMMVGFPGETDEEFEESLRLYEHIRFDGAFTFAFSPRPGTKAAARPDQIPKPVRIARLERLIEMQNRITIEKNEALVAQVPKPATAEVLVDGPAPRGKGLLAGRARSNKQIVFPGEPELRGALGAVRLTKAHLWGFDGQLMCPTGPS